MLQLEPRVASYLAALKQQVGDRRAPLRRLLVDAAGVSARGLPHCPGAAPSSIGSSISIGSRRWCCGRSRDDYFVLALEPE